MRSGERETGGAVLKSLKKINHSKGRLFLLTVFFAFVLTVGVGAGGKAETEDSGQGVNVDSQNRSAFGRDVVAYFSLENNASSVMGKEDYRYEWKGALWLFSSRENLDVFSTDPERYAPEYGGYCSHGMANDYLIYSDPEAWAVYKGNLYLFHKKRGRFLWRGNRDNCIEMADENWPEHLEDLVAGRHEAVKNTS